MTKPVLKTVLISGLAAMFMFGFSFALSPLYTVFCKTTGFNTSVRIANPNLNRTITIQFVATNNKNLPWEFYPRTTSIVIHPEENARVVFFAKNTTRQAMTIQAIPSFAPTLAAQHFHKTQCFCFNKQTLKAGESAEMPVIFNVDDELPKEIKTITLAYTLFDITPKLPQGKP